VDAPVSGGVGGAEAGTLTFMVGGRCETTANVSAPMLKPRLSSFVMFVAFDVAMILSAVLRTFFRKWGRIWSTVVMSEQVMEYTHMHASYL
jgi:hypothetical protein